MKIELNRIYRIQLVGHPILCAELRQRLIYESYFEIPVEITASDEVLFDTLHAAKPDIILLDMTLDEKDDRLYRCLDQMQDRLEVSPYVIAIHSSLSLGKHLLRLQREQTPAMAAGFTDHRWCTLDILSLPLVTEGGG